jgi:hypothetical protein
MTTCVPAATGVPGLSGPPDWLTGTPATNPQRDNLYDPRWRGCAAQGFPLIGGGGEEVSFRAVYDASSGVKRLYLSWNVKVDPQLSNGNDKIYLGLRAPGAGGAMVIEITAYGTSSANIVNKPPDDPSVAGGISTFQRSGSSWASIGDPSWVTQNTRVWLTTSPSPTWAIQTVVPIQTSGGLTNPNGPQLSDTFGLWYFAQVTTSAGFVPYEWKPGSAATTPGNILTGNFPDPATWDSFHLSSGAGDAACPNTGVALQWSDIGTTNSPSSNIRFSNVNPRPTNTFFARPRNYTGGQINAGQISARFRIANWGSIADPNTSWVDIPGGALVASSSAIPAIAYPNDPPGTNPISFGWALNDTDIATFVTGSTPHKCMLVDLSGAGLTFLNNSVFRNMDFVSASTFKREAEISIKGLAPISPAPRAVYLYVETANMPAFVAQPPKGEEPPSREVGASILLTHDSVGTVSTTSIDEQLQTVPTYRVHVYHDTGETVTVGGQTRPVLHPQTPFGYYLSHSGALGGWQHDLGAPPEAQLQQISENFYKIVVPNDGAVRVTTTITALEPGAAGILQSCLLKVAAILVLILGALLKLAQQLKDRLTP